MLVFFALCAFLQTPLGASVPPSNTSSSAATPDAFGAMACECPISSSDDGGEHLRTVYDIVKSCLLTIFACVWQSAHPNINGPRDSGWARLKRRIVTMLCMIIAPEAALVWALQQRSSAKEIAETYNKEFAKVEMETSLWRKVKGWFLPLPKETTWRGDGQLWTTTHGFFIQMGGFILYDNGYPKEVLNYERLAELLRSEKIDAPAVTERDLQDRSKGDAISKAIVVVQTIWFVLQCFARWGQHLPLSELEVITLAFAVMNAAIYAVWWNKPQGVDMAISVPLKSAKEEVGVSTISTDEVLQEEINGSEHPQLRESVSLHQGDYQQLHVDDGLPLIPRDEQQWDESTGERHSWLRRKLREDREQHSPPLFFLCYLPIRIVGSVFRPLGKMLGGHVPERDGLRMSMFHAQIWSEITRFLLSFLAPCVLGTVFGAIHLIAWALEFPSYIDRVLWRVSAVILTLTPFLLQFYLWIVIWGGLRVGIRTSLSLYCCVGLLYAVARCVVIIIALRAIRHPPSNVLRDVSWTSHLPHF